MTRLEYLILGLIYEASCVCAYSGRRVSSVARLDLGEEIEATPIPLGWKGGRRFPYRSAQRCTPTNLCESCQSTPRH